MAQPSAGFVELCGLAGVGKTQLILDACCRAAMPSESRVVLIDTEGAFDPHRFREIATASTGDADMAARLVGRMFVYRTFDALELQAVLCDLLDSVRLGGQAQSRSSSSRPPFNALFVDSIAFPFRSDQRRLKDCWSAPLACERRSGVGPPGSLDRGLARESWDAADQAMEAEAGHKRSMSGLADVGGWLQEMARHRVTVMVTNHLRESGEGFAPALPWCWTRQAARRILVERLRPSGQRQLRLLTMSIDGALQEGDAIGFRIGPAGVQGDDEGCSDEEGGTDSAGILEGGFSLGVGDTASDGNASENDCSAEDSDTCAPETTHVFAYVCAVQSTGLWPPPWWDSRPSPPSRTVATLLDLAERRGVSGVASTMPWPVGALFGSGGAEPWPSGIIEICGEAGTGKTQFCLECIVASLVPAVVASRALPRPSVCYIYSETPPMKRLSDILTARIGSVGVADEACVEDMLSSVFLQKVTGPTELYRVLCNRIPALHQHTRLRLLVVDSMAALCRGIDMDAASRSLHLFRLAAVLQRLAAEREVVVLVTNHVMADFDAGSDWVKPALGHTWASCVTHRVIFQRSTIQSNLSPSNDWRQKVFVVGQHTVMDQQPNFML